MKNWLIENFLPMWARQTVLQDNRELKRTVQALRRENKELRSYIRGLETALRAMRHKNFCTGGTK